MAERGAKEKPPIVLIDTNVIIEGAIHLQKEVDSPEAKVWSAFLGGRLKMTLSEMLLLEVTAVARRLVSKDFASKLRSQVLSRTDVIPNAKLEAHISRFRRVVPDEDVVHAALASASKVQYVISNNREFLRSLRGEFRCLTPKSFVEIVHL